MSDDFHSRPEDIAAMYDSTHIKKALESLKVHTEGITVFFERERCLAAIHTLSTAHKLRTEVEIVNKALRHASS